ncbi:MAG TPA: DUF2141 domain-containing protein [Ideonella sp.]|uniref:DUF2141 domain-containing protein n=1 Tax=Ideonella sp. TaxID=1929293 RepID=UPI002E2F9D20|nr:DUF2141 domain-containing protein [Ideonella sp.]HEX5686998.1 DUF2141 domain-containing protein [Ideonella sp.]
MTTRPTLSSLHLLPAMLLVMTLAAPATAATLTIEVQQVATPGELMVAVFDQAGQWLKQPLRGLRQAAAAGTMTVQVPDLPDGDYAVSLFVDRNANGKLDSNAIGMPTEPYAFSNDAAGNFGPPSFDKAKLSVKGDTRAVIHLP